MKLSVIIITLNEERNIARCIDSIQSISDETIVVDSGSEDKTEEIALSKNVRFHKIEWKSYGAARNLAAERAENDWILALDADEAPSKELLASLQRLKTKTSEEKKVYSFNRLTNYCGHWIRHSGWYPDSKIRLYNRKHTKWNNAIVHEALENVHQLKIQHLKGDLLHYSYYSRAEHRERADKYSRLTALKNHRANKAAGFLKPFLSMVAKFISMYILKLGFLDGRAGFDIARISALSNKLKYEELRKLNRKSNG